MTREPELDVDEPACGLGWTTGDLQHVCTLILGHTGGCECHCSAYLGGVA